MAGRNGPFPVLSLVEDCCGDTTKQTQKAFYISFYRPPRLVCFVTLGEEEKEEKKCDSQSLSSRIDEIAQDVQSG